MDQNEDLKKGFLDLNNDVLFLILNEMNLFDLFNVVQVNPKFVDLAVEVIRKNPSYKLTINLFKRKHTEKQFEVFDVGIIIRNLQMGINILKYFGRGLRRLSIYYNEIEGPQLGILDQFINQYCTETVKQLELKFVNENVLNQLTVPFKEVEDLTCRIKSKNLNAFKPWNELFPKIRRFDLSFHSESINFFDVEFPYLENFVLWSTGEGVKRNLEQFELFFKKNPTIQSVKIGLFPDLLKQMAQLPKLENLTIDSYNFEDVPIYLESVQNMVLQHLTSIKHFSLPNLNALTMHVSSGRYDAYIPFFKKHTELRRLHLNKILTKKSSEMRLDQLTLYLPNRVDVTVNFEFYSREIFIESITSFIESHRQLQIFNFITKIIEIDDEKTLQQSFANEWSIEVFKHDSSGNIYGEIYEKKIKIECKK